MELLNYTALRCTMTEVCECEIALKFSDIIVLINAVFTRKLYALALAFTRKKNGEFTRAGISFSAGRWMSFFGTTAFK